MDKTDTRRRLDRITDPGLFEELATAVLRELDPDVGSSSTWGPTPTEKPCRVPRMESRTSRKRAYGVWWPFTTQFRNSSDPSG